jgi:AAA+ ATPase superfamily predicted ATPase
MISNRVGPPVRGSDFYGRETFVELISEKLKVGNVLLAAPRRFGKTSVMYNLIDRPRWNYKVVHSDLEDLIEPAELITQLVVQLASAQDNRLSKIANSLSYFPKKLWSAFARNFEEVELFKVKFKLKNDLRPRWRESGEELFKRIAGSEISIIFFLDELPMMIDRMARSDAHREEAKTLLRWLRAMRLSPNSENVRFLIAGSIGIGHVLNDLGEISAINDFEQVRLEPFPKKVAFEFLDKMAETHKLSISQPGKQKILELIGTPVPYFIQIIFSEIAKTYAQDGEPITQKRIEKIYHEKVLGVDCKSYFDHYYGRLRDYYQPHEEKAAKHILRELAAVGSMTRDACYQFYKSEFGDKADIEEFNRLMDDLENDFYVRFDSEASRYEFACKLLRDWWLRHYGM